MSGKERNKDYKIYESRLKGQERKLQKKMKVKVEH